MDEVGEKPVVEKESIQLPEQKAVEELNRGLRANLENIHNLSSKKPEDSAQQSQWANDINTSAESIYSGYKAIPQGYFLQVEVNRDLGEALRKEKRFSYPFVILRWESDKPHYYLNLKRETDPKSVKGDSTVLNLYLSPSTNASPFFIIERLEGQGVAEQYFLNPDQILAFRIRAGNPVFHGHRLRTRRDFLKTMGKAAAAAFILDSAYSNMPNQIPVGITKPLWEQIETETLGITPKEWSKKIERDLGLKVINPEDLKSVQFGEYSYQTISWDTPRLKNIYEALSEFPRHFFEPHQKGEQKYPVKLVLFDPPFDFRKLVPFLDPKFLVKEPKGAFSFCNCYNAENPLVVLAKGASGGTLSERQQRRRLLAHEFTHVVTTPDVKKYVQAIAEPIGINEQADLLKIFGSEVDFDKLKNPNDLHYDDIRNRSHVGYGAKNFYEFFAVAAEFYFEGKQKFIEAYQKFLGKDRTEKFYEGMKRELFSGKEY